MSRKVARARGLVVSRCKRCGHVILQRDIDDGKSTKVSHNEVLCNTLDREYGARKKSRK